jgi:hypothetical protein
VKDVKALPAVWGGLLSDTGSFPCLMLRRGTRRGGVGVSTFICDPLNIGIVLVEIGEVRNGVEGEESCELSEMGSKDRE